MPFSDFNRPSLELGLLKAGLTRAGMSCHVTYLNNRFAEVIGRENYMRIDNFSAAPVLGEWVFSEGLFEGVPLPDAQSYYNVVLRPALLEPFGGNEEAFRQTVQEPELLDGLLALRARARQFVSTCFREYDWSQYNIVGFGTTFQQNVAALALARRIKAAFPDTP